MPIADLHKVYPNRNAEIRALCKQLYEFGATVARIPSASMSSGLDEHSIRRQLEYLDHSENMVTALSERPIPDLPGIHPLSLDIDLSKPYVHFSTDVEGSKVPINETTQLLSEAWMITAVELAKSQSASMPGALFKFDFDRAVNNLSWIRKLIVEIQERPLLDLPETAEPGADLEVTGTGGK